MRKEIGLAIYRARAERKLSQRRFAAELGRVLGHPVSRSQISEWETGTTEPISSILVGSALVAGAPLSQFLRERDLKIQLSAAPLGPLAAERQARAAIDRAEGQTLEPRRLGVKKNAEG